LQFTFSSAQRTHVTQHLKVRSTSAERELELLDAVRPCPGNRITTDPKLFNADITNLAEQELPTPFNE